MQSWVVLVAAIACEVAGTVFMKLSDSLTRWVWIPPMLVAYILALNKIVPEDAVMDRATLPKVVMPGLTIPPAGMTTRFWVTTPG